MNEVLILGIGGFSCEFSPDRADGSWESVGVFYPIKDVFRIPIPVKFIGTDVFFRATSVPFNTFFPDGGSVVPDSDGDGVRRSYRS